MPWRTACRRRRSRRRAQWVRRGRVGQRHKLKVARALYARVEEAHGAVGLAPVLDGSAQGDAFPFDDVEVGIVGAAFRPSARAWTSRGRPSGTFRSGATLAGTLRSGALRATGQQQGHRGATQQSAHQSSWRAVNGNSLTDGGA